MRTRILAALLLLTATVPATAHVSIGISIGFYPSFVVVPGYPVYYAPDVNANFFFYDGFYWVYQNDNWYTSSWYDGPWDAVDPLFVPIYVLQVPVRYYRRPPRYFYGWQAERAQRWNDHWGRDWVQRRGDWDRPQRAAYVAPAPLPDYQRRYFGKDYPRGDQQRSLEQQNYRYHSQSTADRPNPARQARSEESRPAQPQQQERRAAGQPWQQRAPAVHESAPVADRAAVHPASERTRDVRQRQPVDHRGDKDDNARNDQKRDHDR
jgi:hypothetical protein